MKKLNVEVYFGEKSLLFQLVERSEGFTGKFIPKDVLLTVDTKCHAPFITLEHYKKWI